MAMQPPAFERQLIENLTSFVFCFHQKPSRY